MKALSFDGSGFEYFKIWIVNMLLTIVTLGLYHPWAKVRKQRYFYGNTKLEGRNFDYHATGKQLFIGYLISMGLLIVYIVIQQISPILSAILLVVFLLALPWIIWRSIKFNMSVTSFSNVRFGFDGGLGGAYFVYMLMPIITFISLYLPIVIVAATTWFLGGSLGVVAGVVTGLAVIISVIFVFFMYGLLKQKSNSYFINASRYGQGQFSTQLKAGVFAKIAAKTLGLSLLVLILYSIFLAIIAHVSGVSTVLLGLVGSLQDPEAINEVLLQSGVLMLVALLYLGFIFISVIIYSYLYTRQREYVLANSKLDKEISFQSTLSARKLAFISVTNFIAIIFTLGLAIPWASVRMTRYLLEHTRVDTSHGFEQYVTRQQEKQSSLGDQIGDAFDVDVGIGI